MAILAIAYKDNVPVYNFSNFLMANLPHEVEKLTPGEFVKLPDGNGYYIYGIIPRNVTLGYLTAQELSRLVNSRTEEVKAAFAYSDINDVRGSDLPRTECFETLIAIIESEKNKQ